MPDPTTHAKSLYFHFHFSLCPTSSSQFEEIVSFILALISKIGQRKASKALHAGEFFTIQVLQYFLFLSD